MASGVDLSYFGQSVWGVSHKCGSGEVSAGALGGPSGGSACGVRGSRRGRGVPDGRAALNCDAGRARGVSRTHVPTEPLGMHAPRVSVCAQASRGGWEAGLETRVGFRPCHGRAARAHRCSGRRGVSSPRPSLSPCSQAFTRMPRADGAPSAGSCADSGVPAASRVQALFSFGS